MVHRNTLCPRVLCKAKPAPGAGFGHFWRLLEGGWGMLLLIIACSQPEYLLLLCGAPEAPDLVLEKELFRIPISETTNIAFLQFKCAL